MSWLFPKLKNRVQVGVPVQTANDDGGLDFGFSAALTIWMGFQTIGYRGGAKYVRGKQVSEAATHEFICRSMAVASLGKEFALAFALSFDSMSDLAPLKSDYFLFVQKGSTSKGRLFRIHDATNIREEDEYLSIIAEELEERGTGYGA